MTSPISITINAAIATVEIKSPPVNALGFAVRKGLHDSIDTLETNPAVQAIILTGEGRFFSAGADITEFGKPPRGPSLFEVCNRIEACTKPVIAAINGTALGGGLEIALAAHFRLAAPTAKLGLPEILLGLLPGAGGTQRLPHLCGVNAALDIILSGAQITADKAHRLGVIDMILEADPLESATKYAQTIIETGRKIARSSDRVASNETDADRRAAIATTRETLAKTAKNLLAPHKIVDCVEASFSGTFANGQALELAAFQDCAKSNASLGLRHAFAAERRCTKIPEVARAKPRKLEHIGVIGGGTMGAGITVAALDGGLHVTMIERDAQSIARGQANVEKVYDRKIAKGRMTAEKKAAIMARYTPSITYDDLSDVDLTIEAVFEDMSVKKTVFKELDRVMRKGAILASNTSYLDINEIARSTSRPSDVIGLHFFSPANIMKLLEIVISDDVSDDVVATGFALAKMMRKTPVRAGVCDGFIGNRILTANREIATLLMEDGASPYEIDIAIRDFGYPIGIFQMFDLAGNDIGWAMRKRLAPSRDPNRRYVEISDRICENGWFGQKTGRGFYRYPEGTRIGVPDPEVLAIIDTERAKKAIPLRAFSHDEIRRRYFAAMINEAANVVHDGTALRPSDVDVVLLYGYGFPRFRGGPMKYADTYGLPKLLADIREFEKEDPLIWKASPLLVALVEKGADFDSLNNN